MGPSSYSLKCLREEKPMIHWAALNLESGIGRTTLSIEKKFLRFSSRNFNMFIRLIKWFGLNYSRAKYVFPFLYLWFFK